MFNNLINLIVFYLFKDRKYIFNKKVEELKNDFPLGLFLQYEGIDFFVVGFSSDGKLKKERARFNQDKIYVIFEYFDAELRRFRTKIMHEDFVRNRYKVFTGISKRN